MNKLAIVFIILSTFIFASNIKELNSSNFKSTINSSKPTLVKFYSNNCQACILMAPHYKRVSKEFASKIRYAELNIDNYPNLRQKYQVVATPTTILFKNGKEIDRAIGGYNYKYLKSWAKNIINYFKTH